MGFLGVYKAIYDYTPQSEGELQITEGDLLYVLEKNTEDDWWKAKKKAGGDDEDEPEGLIPNNYVEEVDPSTYARALYEYTRQTDEELSFPEDATLEVFDTSDPDWILVGFEKEYGFVPANYIEISSEEANVPESEREPMPPLPPSLPARPALDSGPSVESLGRRRSTSARVSSPMNSPAAALAGVMAGKTLAKDPTPPISPQSARHDLSEASDDDGVRSPALPTRPNAQPSPRAIRYEVPPERRLDRSSPARPQPTPGGFHMYNINEMVSVMGKRKKMPTTLGVNLGTGTILIAPERTQDGPSQEWTAEKMTHYSREGKHVFLELVRPSKSVDFHAGAKDTAEEIVSALGELSGAVKAEGLREVIMAGTGQTQKRGKILYDFMAQGDDEVTVGVDDEVMIIDDTKSEEWWQVRRLKNGKEGVVPSSYIEITGAITPSPAPAIMNTAKSTVEQNRLEEIRLTKEAVKAARGDSTQQVGPGMPLPERGSSLTARENGNNSGQQRSKRENGRADVASQANSSKSKPDREKVRTWTDRSKSFSVEAQFLGIKDGKINLHKMNGVKIAVPVVKMSIGDIEYIERMTGMRLDVDRPSGTKKAKATGEPTKGSSSNAAVAGATIEPRRPEYDWFQFFLSCDVTHSLCERYAQAFIKDSMDESVLPDVDGSILRTLGLREGDIIKVMRALDARFGRVNKGKRTDNGAEAEDGNTGGLFSGPGGALRNNTRRGRPEPSVVASDIINPKAFSAKDETEAKSPTAATVRPGSKPRSSGFEDDAWDVKPSKQQSPPPAQRSVEPVPDTRVPTGSLQELSLLSAPLEPTKVEAPKPTEPSLQLAPASTAPASTQQPRQTGATPSFFAGVAAQVGTPESAVAHPAGIVNGPLGNIQAARQRPAAPQHGPGAGSLMPPPPARPLSAPQAAQQSAFSPPPLGSIVPQMTGVHPALQGQPAAPGQSLNDINQARLQQQQYALQLQAQQTGTNPYGLQPQQQPLVPFPTGVQPHPGFLQAIVTGIQPVQSPFADPIRPPQFAPMQQLQPQATGFPGQFSTVQSFGQPSIGPINNYLPPPLVPGRTGMPATFQPPATSAAGFNAIGGSSPMPTPTQPLAPQQTGPAPPVRFGVVPEAKKLAPQPTGRRANLSQATPQNPFGF